MLDMLGLKGFRQNGAHDKRTEGGRETGFGGHHHHHETKGQRNHQQSFVVHQGTRLAQDERNDVNTHHKPQDKEEHQFEYAHGKFAALEVGRNGHGG